MPYTNGLSINSVTCEEFFYTINLEMGVLLLVGSIVYYLLLKVLLKVSGSGFSDLKPHFNVWDNGVLTSSSESWCDGGNLFKLKELVIFSFKMGGPTTFPTLLLLIPLYSFYVASINFSSMYQDFGELTPNIFGVVTATSFQWGWGWHLVMFFPKYYHVIMYMVEGSLHKTSEDFVLSPGNLFNTMVVLESVKSTGETPVVPNKIPVNMSTYSLDVNHSFGFSEFGVKVDSTSDKMSEWFLVLFSNEGFKTVECYEFCGLNHFNMWTSVVPLNDLELSVTLKEPKYNV